MPMSNETIKALNYIVDAHNDGSDDQVRADKHKVNVATIRAVLSLLKKLGTEVKRQKGSGRSYTADEKTILRAAMQSAQAKIAEMRGHQR